MLELILVVFAWRRGWRWKALLPLAGEFMLGLLLGLSGAGDATGVLVLAAIASIGTLIWMIAHPPQAVADSRSEEPEGSPAETAVRSV
jgi:hypothetical protein